MEPEMKQRLSSEANTAASVVAGDYIVISELGQGSFSTVWKAVHKENGQVVALKQVHLSRLNRHLKTCLDCEIEFLSSVHHPNIIQLLQAFQDEGCIFEVLEFCDGGNLAAYIRHHGRVREHIARRFMQQLGAGLEILHSHHIIHRDLKPENILLSGTGDDVVVKVADFGLSRSLCPGDYAETVCGSPLYMAPEVLQFQRYDGKVDMWSVGVILFELLNGGPPFTGRTNVQVLKNIKSSACLPFDQLILSRLHPDSVDICSKLLALNPGLKAWITMQNPNLVEDLGLLSLSALASPELLMHYCSPPPVVPRILLAQVFQGF